MQRHTYRLSRVARLFIHDSFDSHAGQLPLKLSFVVYAYLVGIGVVILLAISNAYSGRHFLLFTDVLLVSSIIMLLLMVRYSRRYKAVFHSTVVIFALIILGILVSGETYRAVIATPIIMLLAFFLLGGRAGIVWTILVQLTYILHFTLAQAYHVDTAFTFASLTSFCAIQVFIALLLYEFGGIYEKTEQFASEQALKLSHTNKQLQAELDKNQGLTARMQHVIETTERNNAILEESKKALINVLEDSNELQVQLTEEKAGVEAKIEERTRQLQEEQARLQASIDTLELGFLMTLDDGTSILYNPALLEITGLTLPEGGDGTTQLLDMLSTTLKPGYKLDNAVKNCLKTGEPFKADDVTLGGKALKILGSAIRLDDTSKPLGVVLLIQDISQEKDLERSKDEFISIASHELRTPLTAIRGNISLLQMLHAETFTEPEVKEMMDDINDSVIRLISIVNQFLTTSRLEQKKTVFQFSDVDTAKVIKRVSGELKPMADESKLGMELQLPAKLPKVKSDESRLQSVLNNLIGNAIKYTDTGTITISAAQEKNNVVVRVADTGKGMDKANQKLLFRKFQQASDNILTRDDSRSTGLGLYITKLMVDQMGGKIELESSTVGKGSVFRLTLPLA